MVNISYNDPCRNEKFINLKKCKGYQDFCRPYNTSFKTCNLLLPRIGKGKPKVTLEIANGHYENINETYKKKFIDLFPKMMFPSEEEVPFDELSLNFLDESFKKTFKEIWKKTQVSRELLYPDIVNFGLTVFDETVFEDIYNIANNYFEKSKVGKNEKEVLGYVFGDKWTKAFLTALEETRKQKEKE